MSSQIYALAISYFIFANFTPLQGQDCKNGSDKVTLSFSGEVVRVNQLVVKSNNRDYTFKYIRDSYYECKLPGPVKSFDTPVIEDDLLFFSYLRLDRPDCVFAFTLKSQRKKNVVVDASDPNQRNAFQLEYPSCPARVSDIPHVIAKIYPRTDTLVFTLYLSARLPALEFPVSLSQIHALPQKKRQIKEKDLVDRAAWVKRYGPKKKYRGEPLVIQTTTELTYKNLIKVDEITVTITDSDL
jgi:hypothetical protein